jgi:hypothetical protein
MNSTTDIFRLTRGLFHYAFVLAAFLTTAGIITANSAHAAIFVVSNTNDDGQGSFRRAVEDANDRLGPDLIKFEISGTGIKTITLQVDYAGLHSRIDILDTVIIDGWTQGPANYQGPPLIEFRCVGNANFCLTFTSDDFRPSNASNSLLRGIIISEAGGALNISGTASQTVDHVTVQGCYIGTNASGTGAGQVGGIGILMQSGSRHQIGGAQASQRNVISSTAPEPNPRPAIQITHSDHNIIEGNYIGLDRTGSVVLPNGGGLFLNRSNNNRIGGTAPGQRNVISGNLRNGVAVFGSNNSVLGNYIGTLADGVSAAGNGMWGVVIGGDSVVPTSKNNIGGATSAAGNVICDNGNGPPTDGGGGGGGIVLATHTSRNTIKNNLIGVGAVGRTSVGNHGEGILIQDSSLNSIGGIATLGRFSLGGGNTIMFNSRAGIRIVKGTRNHLSGNSIWDNGGSGSGLGIDLSPLDVLGVTANDDCDVDTGPNRLQNFPVIDRVVSSPSGVTIEGVLRSSPPGIVSPGIPTRASNGKYEIEFFSNKACSRLGNGQGETFLGSTTVSLKSKSCSARFRTTLNVQLRPGMVITATATDSLNNTSEFSQCFPVVGGGF